MSSIHWKFWVMRARLEMRLRNIAVERSGSRPFRSSLRTHQKNTAMMPAPPSMSPTQRSRLLSAARMPSTKTISPSPERTAPATS